MLLIIGTNCKKERPTYFMPQEFKDYVMFPVGSYWIYEDSISGKIDSVIILAQTVKICKPPSYNDPGYDYECLGDWIYNSNINSTYSRIGIYNDDIANNVTNSYVYKEGHSLFISNIPIGRTYYNLTYEFYYDSIILNNNLYKNVKVFSTTGQYYCGFFLRTYYSRYVGLIKMIVTQNDTSGTKVLELKKHLINR